MKTNKTRRTRRALTLAGTLLLACALTSPAADIAKGYTFTPGERNVTHSKLNNLVDLAVINPEFITSKTAAGSVASNDYVLIYSAIPAALRKVQMVTLMNKVRTYFTSTNYPFPTSSGLCINTPHTLAATPSYIRITAVCVSNRSDYAVGDEVPIEMLINTSADPPFTYGANATNVFCIHKPGGVSIRNKSTGTVEAINDPDWKIKAYAMALTD